MRLSSCQAPRLLPLRRETFCVSLISPYSHCLLSLTSWSGIPPVVVSRMVSGRRLLAAAGLLHDRRRIGADASAGSVGLAFARQPHVKADAGHALYRAVGIIRHDVDREIARRAEHDVIGQMRVVAQIERGDQF